MTGDKQVGCGCGLVLLLWFVLLVTSMSRWGTDPTNPMRRQRSYGERAVPNQHQPTPYEMKD